MPLLYSIDGTNYKYGILIVNSANTIFKLIGSSTEESFFELADNSLIDGSNGKGVIGIFLTNNSKLNFINGSINYSKKQEIKLGHDIRSSIGSYPDTTITFSDYSNIDLGTHIIEAATINIERRMEISVNLSKNKLVGNFKGIGLSSHLRNYDIMIFEPSFAEDFEDDGEGELKYKVISGFGNIIGKERIKLKDVRRKLEWNGGVYSTKLVCEGNDFSIVLNRIVPPIKIDNTSENSDDNGSDDW